MLEQPQQNEVHCRASTCAVRGLSRAARFSDDFAVLPPPACPAHVANVAKQLEVPITEARRAVRTGRVLACLAGASADEHKAHPAAQDLVYNFKDEGQLAHYYKAGDGICLARWPCALCSW